MWKTALVEKTIVGKDGYKRGAKVKMASIGKLLVYLNRPIQKLYPLEIRNKDNAKNENEMVIKLSKDFNSKEERIYGKESSA